jgi:GTP-binding protein
VVVDANKAKKALKEEESGQKQHVFTLHTDELPWNVEKNKNGTFEVSGKKIEKFARRTDFENFHSCQRLRDIMKKMGITHELSRKGAKHDSEIVFPRIKESLHLTEQED